ncbi:hypothetical protein XA68_18100 [Ophiocordyceps unilateralis]|uniref:Uncharacterized protein n=1 Tax=Ophiocordyceps unilateralis TaxID=268505 RepID=A0A2A9PJU5_OPHUN|nr:hypothetical protein XA68_18100 [Ophiocordyceps unilateralis]
MLCQLSRVSRVGVVRLARRTFMAPTISRRADFVQELYLKELKAYKVPPVKESDSQGQVQTFTMPKTPSSPEETDLAGSLKQYESMGVDIEGQDASSSASAGPATLPDWLEAEEDDEPKQAH